MGFGAPNPGLWGESARKALSPGQEKDARDHATSAEQHKLDQADLRQFERSGSYEDVSEAPSPSRLRRIVARIFRRPA